MECFRVLRCVFVRSAPVRSRSAPALLGPPQAQLKADEEFFDSLKQGCKTKADEWAARYAESGLSMRRRIQAGAASEDTCFTR